MICWVAERAQTAHHVARVIVATDDRRVFDAVRHSGYDAVMTRDDHASGTDRLAEVVESLSDAKIIVNVQGDEPLIASETIDHAIEALVYEQRREEQGARDKGRSEDEKGDTTAHGSATTVGIVTTWESIDSAADVLNPDVVKMVVDDNAYAVYFSRAPVPFPRDAVRRHGTIAAALENEPALLKHFRKHTGLYVYRRDLLLEFTRWPQSALERLEGLEQLRALEHGVKIKVIEGSAPSIGVDTIEDLERVRALVKKGDLSLQVTSTRESVNTCGIC